MVVELAAQAEYEKHMRRQRVDSTSLESIGFDPATNQLEIQFRAGGVYRYAVPRRIYRELMKASSLGAFFARRIRHAYPGWKVEG
ncbi:KTSC domain-containing protein [Nakamurella sp. GG22]